jgi:hypothetical protein
MPRFPRAIYAAFRNAGSNTVFANSLKEVAVLGFRGSICVGWIIPFLLAQHLSLYDIAASRFATSGFSLGLGPTDGVMKHSIDSSKYLRMGFKGSNSGLFFTASCGRSRNTMEFAQFTRLIHLGEMRTFFPGSQLVVSTITWRSAQFLSSTIKSSTCPISPSVAWIW